MFKLSFSKIHISDLITICSMMDDRKQEEISIPGPVLPPSGISGEFQIEHTTATLYQT